MISTESININIDPPDNRGSYTRIEVLLKHCETNEVSRTRLRVYTVDSNMALLEAMRQVYGTGYGTNGEIRVSDNKSIYKILALWYTE